MANYIATDTELTSVANAIRAKGETSDPLVFPSGFVSAINAIPTGGGGGGITIVDTPDTHGGTIREIITNGDVKGIPASVEFIDYDGTIVTTKTKAQIEAMESDSDLPAFPSHEGLVAQGWNWTVAQLKAQLTAMPEQTVYVGQMYITQSGKTEIDVEMQEGRLNPILTICVDGEITVDWGDGTTPDTVTGNSETVRQAIPHSYTTAGSYTILVSVISGSFTFYGSSSYSLLRKNTTTNENRVYSNCVRQIRFGNGINSIEVGAFYYCCALKTITIPNCVTSIGNNAFYCCYSLLSVTIPSSVTNIGTSLFYYCYSLISATIPNSVTSIPTNMFYCCYSLLSVTIPSSVTSIGSYAFYYCSALSSVMIPSGVTSIENNTFDYCYSLSNITIPSSVTSIGDKAFDYCYSLSNITIPSSVTSIGNNAFYFCYSLIRATIPNSVTSIGNNAFNYCYSITNITIPNSVTSIGISAFSTCYSITNITIPNDVTSIGNSAFSYCYGVSEYHVLPTTPPTIGTTVFNRIVSDCIIYVPQGTLSAYQSATNWSTYASYMQEES